MTRRAQLRRRTVPAALIVLTAGLCSLAPAPQAAATALPSASLLSADGLHSCAISSGKAYCWGYGPDGALGDGSTANSDVPVAVDTSGVLAGKTLTQISAGDDHTCALDSSGAAYCWGDNGSGELGNGNTVSSSVPVPVDTSGLPAGQTLTQIGTGYADTCALDTAGAAYCGGGNFAGEVGGGAGIGAISTVPVAVDTSGALANKTLTQVTAGESQTCALDSVGAAYCWGDNTYGELGDDSTSDSDVPVPVLAGPGPPTDVTAAPGDASATVSWTAPTYLDGGILTGYTPSASPGGAACTTSATSCTITGLANGVTYSITVVAHTTVGDSAVSFPASVTPEPAGETTGPIVSGDRTTKCIDDSNSSAANDTPIVISDCNGNPEQSWMIEPDGTIQINGKCMDIYRDGKANKTPAELWTCTGGANQQWKASNGALVNPASGKCLDDPKFNITNGTQLEIYACNGGLNQQWHLP